jgi:hypothetical protein
MTAPTTAPTQSWRETNTASVAELHEPIQSVV